MIFLELISTKFILNREEFFMKLKRIAAAVLAAVTLVLAMAVPVSAASIFDTAKNIDSGKKVTKTLERGKSMDYKITPTEKGTATVKLTAKTNCCEFYVYDADGNEISFTCDATLGSMNKYNKNLYWDSTSEVFKGTLSFDVKANKTYYIKIKQYSYAALGDWEFTASFKYPSEEVEETVLMTLNLKKGGTVQLGANGDKASWKSSQKSIATVSDSGLVTAVKKGKTVITLKCGSKTQKIEVVVE